MIGVKGRKTLLLFSTIFIMLSFSACSSNNLSGKYISLWNSENYYEFKNGEYTTNSSNSEGAYTVDNELVTLSDNKGNEIKYTISGKYLLGEAYYGTIPNKDWFSVVCSTSDNDLSMEFFENGTFERKISLFGINQSDFKGVYERDNNIIILTFNDGTVCEMLIIDNLLYEAYVKK